MIQLFFFFFQAEDGIRDDLVTGVQTCALPISPRRQGGGSVHAPEPTASGAAEPAVVVAIEQDRSGSRRSIQPALRRDVGPQRMPHAAYGARSPPSAGAPPRAQNSSPPRPSRRQCDR